MNIGPILLRAVLVCNCGPNTTELCSTLESFDTKYMVILFIDLSRLPFLNCGKRLGFRAITYFLLE